MPKLVITVKETYTQCPNHPDHMQVNLACFLEIEFEDTDDKTQSILPMLAPVFQAAIDRAIGSSPQIFERIRSATPINDKADNPEPQPDFPAELTVN